MAFTKQPVQDTYQTKQVDIVSPLNKRSADVNKDNDYLNCYFEIVQNKATQDHDLHIVKRPGIVNFSDAFGSTNFRGMYHWEDQNKIFVVVDNDIIVFQAFTGATITTLNNVFGGTTGDVGFTTFYYDDTTTKVVFSDGTNIGTIDSSNTVVTSGDGDVPSPHIPTPIFLDGYIFLAKAGSGDIYNSNLNDPLAWTPGDFISCEMFPDVIRNIAKLNNYLLAFGSESVEYFWDAGNASGTPLQRNDTPIKLLGYLGGLAQHSNTLYFLGRAYQGTPTIYQLEDFKVKEIGTATIRKYLETVTGVSDGVNVKSTILSAGGHDFYALGLGSYTYVFDIKTELWSRFAYGGTDTFVAREAFTNDIAAGNFCIFYITGQDRLRRFNQTTYQDNGSNFTFRFVTNNEMFDSYNQKTMARASIVADAADVVALLQWSDDDYQTFNLGLNIDLGAELPTNYRLGRFRRRAFKFSLTDNFPCRVQKLEVDINLGQH